jgi:nitrite reductase/ring-hydroxylating ferredoxin subunit
MPRSESENGNRNERRGFISKASNLAMLAGLVGGYGAFALIAGRFLYPARPRDRSWMFVTEVDRIKPGESLLYRTPAGETVNVTRQGSAAGAEDFVALSSVCPHLGCQVFWEAQNDRYFCPCHNGTFDADGRGTGGPPGDAGQSLSRYELNVEGGLLYINVPIGSIAERRRAGRVVRRAAGPHGPGHDPCLSPVAESPRLCRQLTAPVDNRVG